MLRSSAFLVLLAGCTPMPELAFNTPPSALVLHIEPASPTTSDTLIGTIDADSIDAEGDDIGYEFAWYKDGVATGIEARTIDPASTAKGQVWELVIVATDGEFAGEEARASVIIVNSPPVVDRVEISPAAPATTDDLALSTVATDADGDVVTWSIVWSRDDVPLSAYGGATSIPEAATGTLEDWSVTATPSDGTDRGETTSVSVYIDNTTPTLGSLRVLPTAPQVQDAVIATVLDVTDPDQPGQTVSVEFAWFVNGVEALRESQTDGSSFLSDGFAKGDEVTVIATPSDGYAIGSPLTSSPITVVNTAPSLDVASLSPTTAYESTTLTCGAGTPSDEDGDSVSYEYAWYVDGTRVSSASSDTLTGTSFGKTDEVYCVMTPDDGDDAGDPVTSNTVTVSNSVPTFTGVTLSPTTPTVATTVTANVSGGDDDDGDSISYTYAWTVNGTAVTSTSSQLSTGNFVRGDSVQVTVTPGDSSGYGTALPSSATEIQNARPTVSSTSITPSTAYTDDDLAVVVSGWSDADGDSANYTYQWYKNSVAMSGATGLTIGEENTTKGDRFYCAVTPNDGYEDGTTRNTYVTTIQNSPPATFADVTTGLTANECDVIEMDASVSTDGDDDSLTYAWSLTTRPTGSNAATADFSSTTAEAPSFLVDYEGNFVFAVAANDGSTSVSDSVTVTVYDAADNVAPVSAPDSTDSDLEQTTGCSSSGSGFVCTPCSGTFTIDASASYDDDGDPLHYTWSTASGYASITSATAESTTVAMRSMPATHLTTRDYQATVTLRVQDCAGNVSTEDLVLTYACTGN